MIEIDQNGKKDFSSIQEALDCLAKTPDSGKGETLFLHSGIYREQITVRIPHLTFLGEEDGSTIITGCLSARMEAPEGGPLRTFRTFTCFIDTHDFTARSITFENSAGKGTEAGQALALYADGDRLFFDSCRFLGNQDTLFTAPLPPREIEPGGFTGPKQNAPRISGRHYYRNCYIEGDIDFIFGGAAAYFEGCTLFSKCTDSPVNSYVTAASTPEGQEFGYVMKDCRFESCCPPHSAFLGRPWREYAQTVLLNCYMDSHICEEGWDDWNKPEAREHAFYAEYESFGPGAAMDRRPEWVRRLTKEEAGRFTKATVLSGNDGWAPE